MTARRYPFGLFEATGLELEYMVVDSETLSVRPIVDELMRNDDGGYDSEIEHGEISWSNELVLHVVELKTNGPAQSLDGIAAKFQANVAAVNASLAPLGARLMPTAMHPWMDPHTEMKLWPHQYSAVYDAFDRVFDCKGHGWANLQSVHINLPFGDEEEFGRLHAAIRLVLPILPALAASSPLADGRPTGFLDTRLEYYRQNARRVPSVSGLVIPERVFTQSDYEGTLLGGIYRDIAPFDPRGILQFEWLNARGCIARFDRGSIEIRVLDVQEAPICDMAVAAATIEVVRALAEERLAGRDTQRAWDVEPLAHVFRQTLRDGDRAQITDAAYLDLFGYPNGSPCVAGDLWQHLVDQHVRRAPTYQQWRPALETIFDQGCLARRILAALGGDTRREHLRGIYERLCRCLADGAIFRA